MQIKYLIDRIRSISGYHQASNSRVNSNILLVNDNMILRAINEAQKFIATTIMPSSFNVPLDINLETDILGNDLVRTKLSSYNEGSKIDMASSTIIGSEKLPIPNIQKTCNVLGINEKNPNNFYYPINIGFNVVYNQNDYLLGSAMNLIGQVKINKYNSETFLYDYLSTFKTSFIAKDKKGMVIGSYSITTETNVYSFDLGSIRISVNYERGLITFSYSGRDIDNYTIDIYTLTQPSNMIYFQKGKLRVSSKDVVNNLRNFSIRIAPYAVWDPTQEICNIYDEDLIEILAYRSALETQRFNGSVDMNISDIVSRKEKEYQNRERFKTFEKSNDIIYPSSYCF